MKIMQYLILFTLLLSLLIATVYAIKCYSCESVYEPNCAEDFEIENHFKLDCSFISPPRFLDNELAMRNATACMKRVFRENGIKKFVRSCYFGDVNETEVGCRMDPMLPAVQNVSCHVCDNENFCNGAESQRNHNHLDKWKILGILSFMVAVNLIKIG